MRTQGDDLDDAVIGEAIDDPQPPKSKAAQAGKLFLQRLPAPGLGTISGSAARTFRLIAGCRPRMSRATSSGTRRAWIAPAGAMGSIFEELRERIERPPARLEGGESWPDLFHALPIEANLHGLVPALELIRTHEHRSRRAVLGDDHLLVGGIDVIKERAARDFPGNLGALRPQGRENRLRDLICAEGQELLPPGEPQWRPLSQPFVTFDL